MWYAVPLWYTHPTEASMAWLIHCQSIGCVAGPRTLFSADYSLNMLRVRDIESLMLRKNLEGEGFTGFNLPTAAFWHTG